MLRLYSNENFPLPVVEELRRLDCDVTTVQETGRAGQSWPDEEVLGYATAEGRAVVTLNRKHFIRLHRSAPQHAGIVICTADLDFPGQARRIHDALQAAGDPHGQLLRVNRPASDRERVESG